MSELGDLFKEWDKEKKAKKLLNVEQSLGNLKAHAIPFVICNELNHHVLVDSRIDFWPSTGKWRERKSGVTGRGVRHLINRWKQLRAA